jgi:hypothetical protein
MANGKHKSQKVITLDKDKVRPEELSSKEHGGLWPFKVDLAVEIYKGSEPIKYTIFLRAPDVAAAQYVATMTFEYFEKTKPGIKTEYPDISNKHQSTMTGLSEEEYMEFWKEAQHFPHVYGGNKKNPSFFRYVKDDKWAIAGNLTLPSKTITNAVQNTVVKKKDK